MDCLLTLDEFVEEFVREMTRDADAFKLHTEGQTMAPGRMCVDEWHRLYVAFLDQRGDGVRN
jgi:hypothetical protein